MTVLDRAKYESHFQTLTRVGFFARGLLYILIGVLVIGAGRTEDVTGALEYLGRGFGRWALAVVAVGMATYGLWRLADAAFGQEHPGHQGKALRKRAAAGLIGVIHLALAWKAAWILVVGRSGGSDVQEHADTVLDLPGGQWMLGFGALVMAIVGFNQLRQAQQCSFLEPLGEAADIRVVKWLGRIGCAARGTIFLAVAYLLALAALANSPKAAGGPEQALDMLSEPVAFAVAAGLILFGLFSMVEARYRRIARPPPVEQVAEKIKEKLAD